MTKLFEKLEEQVVVKQKQKQKNINQITNLQKQIEQIEGLNAILDVEVTLLTPYIENLKKEPIG